MARFALVRVAPMVIAASLLGCDPSGTSTSPDRSEPAQARPLPESEGDPNGGIRLVLHDPSASAGPADRCEVELCTALLELIEGAQTSIDFAVYGVRNQSAIVDALKAAKARGVEIRGIVDRDVDGDNYYTSTDAVATTLGQVRDDRKVDQALEREQKASDRSNRFEAEPPCQRPEGFAGYVQCLAYDLGDRCLLATHASREPFGADADGNTGKAFNKIMHDKFFVVDGRYLWTGSTNVSDSGTGGYNANLVVVLDSPTVASWYTREFENMWVDGKHHQRKPKSGELRTTVGDAEVEVLFSPQDKAISKGVRPLLKNAKTRIDIAVFFLTNKAITKDLIEAHLRGVEVRVILDATAATNGYTKHELLREVGIPVKVEAWGGKMHMKSAAIDGEYVIAGSMNWTSAGEWDNDENTLLIKSPALASQYHEFFEQLWAGIPERWAAANPDPESRDSGISCSDGFDNDYDHRADGEDPGCGDNPPPLAELPPHWIVTKDKITCQHPPRR
ncbi:Phospholipase D precursor [Enhygromyxa salina]|uniref:phospholipase D n=1 Tax=Enhygromyxa salina TaxID=215803 RepID=A0A2S9Y7H8_9BACT|nr:phospholipase D-like domain-containing protein [Enhygromyxa salina]PRQ01070.1 Phospholipase D precursor [Enhygromyxa salina]